MEQAKLWCDPEDELPLSVVATQFEASSIFIRASPLRDSLCMLAKCM